MPDSYQMYFGEELRPAEPEFHGLVGRLEVEENADLPGAFELSMPIANEGLGMVKPSLLDDERFKPYGRVAVVVRPENGEASCIFDGYILSHKIHLDRGTKNSTLKVWGQDVTCLMNLEEVVKAWDGKNDAAIANEIFEGYSFKAAPENEDSDLPTHTKDAVLMQRATDAQFLRERARRSGKLFRVACGDTAGQNTGYFATPDLSASPELTLAVNGSEMQAANLQALDFEWDVARPGQALGQILLEKEEPHSVDTREPGLELLGERTLGAFVANDERVMQARLTVAAESAEDLKLRATSLLREASFFVRCDGECDLAQLGQVLRAARVVEVAGVGSVHSGKYLVWSVRHTITRLSHRMRFGLVRNAVGTSGS